jgi:RHS repeat-associated protein
MSHHPNTTPASPFPASPLPDAPFDSIESLTTSFATSALPTLETTTVTEVALGYHRNQQYSITAMTTSTGAVAERYAYTAYGQPTICNASGSVLTSSAVGNRYTYTGREGDEILTLHHFRARWMSPLAGRFLGRDPISYKGSRYCLYITLSSRPQNKR